MRQTLRSKGAARAQAPDPRVALLSTGHPRSRLSGGCRILCQASRCDRPPPPSGSEHPMMENPGGSPGPPGANFSAQQPDQAPALHRQGPNGHCGTWGLCVWVSSCAEDRRPTITRKCFGKPHTGLGEGHVQPAPIYQHPECSTEQLTVTPPVVPVGALATCTASRELSVYTLHCLNREGSKPLGPRGCVQGCWLLTPGSGTWWPLEGAQQWTTQRFPLKLTPPRAVQQRQTA